MPSDADVRDEMLGRAVGVAFIAVSTACLGGACFASPMLTIGLMTTGFASGMIGVTGMAECARKKAARERHDSPSPDDIRNCTPPVACAPAYGDEVAKADTKWAEAIACEIAQQALFHR